MHTSTSISIVNIESAMQEPVDEHHSVVQDLVSAGYNVEQSIHAVEKRETLEAAMEYLDQQVVDDEDDDEHVLIPSAPGFNQQSSHDEDEYKMTW